jgi:site-specific DNA-methyltransferase (adenine-specific)
MKPYHTDNHITLHQGDALDVLRTLPDVSVHAVVTDPPYGYGIAAWDVPIDTEVFTREVQRVCTGFYAVFGQMPTIRAFDDSARFHGLHFCDHVVWVKRNANPGHRLSRSHESIYIYATGKRKTFYQTDGRYEDVKLPGVLAATVSMEAIDRYIKDLWRKAHGTGTTKKTSKMTQEIHSRFNYTVSDRSPEYCNYTNVWSFLPPMLRERNGEYQHPTEKPLSVMLRLIEMLTPEDGIVLDPFAGSGTTLVAARNLGRRAIGVEMDAGYCETIVDRLAQQALPLFGEGPDA